MPNLEHNIIKKKRGNPAWTKGGAAPNPGGRPKGIHQLIDAACKKYKLDLIDETVKMIVSDTISNKDKANLLADLKDRRYGKALQTQDINVTHPEPITFFCVDDEKSSDNKDI